MVNDLDSMAVAVSEFADGHDMTIVPAVPESGSGRMVSLDAGVLDLDAFLDLARKLGDGALYIRAEAFEHEPGTDESAEVPAAHACRQGQVGELSVAFASAGHGLLHFWEEVAPWYVEWLAGQEAGMPGDTDDEERLTDEERDRLAAEVAEVILADPEFRASSPFARRRRAQMLVPDGTDRWVGSEASFKARERAEELADEEYRPIRAELEAPAASQAGGIAAEFLATPGWQQAASRGARIKAAELFLSCRADGFFPPAYIRDELYAKAQRLRKEGGGSLF